MPAVKYQINVRNKRKILGLDCKARGVLYKEIREFELFDEVINEAKELVNKGYKEIVLTGIHTGSYGRD